MSLTILADIETFTAYLRFEKRYSPHTLKAYRDDLLAFAAFLEHQFGETDTEAVSAAAIRSWLAVQRDQEISPRSLNRRLSSLKSFFKFQVRQGKTFVNPLATISSPKMNRRLPAFVEEKSMQELFTGLAFPEGWEGVLHQTVIKLFYATGIRLSELINLKTGQLDLHKRTLKILGKGNKERIIPFAPELGNVLQAYLLSRQNLFAASNAEYLFVTGNGKQLSPRSVQYFVKKYLGQVTTLQKKSPHVLRHSFATHLMNHGADLNAVKELLGHSSLAATQVYTHNTIEKLKEIHAKAHPRG